MLDWVENCRYNGLTYIVSKEYWSSDFIKENMGQVVVDDQWPTWHTVVGTFLPILKLMVTCYKLAKTIPQWLNYFAWTSRTTFDGKRRVSHTMYIT